MDICLKKMLNIYQNDTVFYVVAWMQLEKKASTVGEVPWKIQSRSFFVFVRNNCVVHFSSPNTGEWVHEKTSEN